MGSVIVDLIPIMIGAALMPAWIIIVLLMLSDKGGLPKAAAFVAGTLLVRSIQGVVFGAVFQREDQAYGEAGTQVLVSTLLLVIGLLLLTLAYKKWTKEEDPDAPPPKWLASLSEMSVGRAFGMGALLMAVGMKHWVLTLTALATITAGQLDQPQSIVAFAIYLLVSASLLLIPLLFSAIAPRRAASALGSARSWLERNNRPVTVIASLVFGLYFAFQGIMGLLG